VGTRAAPSDYLPAERTFCGGSREHYLSPFEIADGKTISQHLSEYGRLLRGSIHSWLTGMSNFWLTPADLPDLTNPQSNAKIFDKDSDQSAQVER
jgi:hypothetical protein